MVISIKWTHTILILIACIALTVIIYKITGWFVFILLFIPPVFAMRRKN